MNQANPQIFKIFSRKRTIELVRKLDSSSSKGSSMYIPPGSENCSLLSVGDSSLPGDSVERASKSTTGFVIFSTEQAEFSQTTLILPPFPVKNKIIKDCIDIQPLESLISRNYVTGIILIRMGALAVGIASGEAIVSSKISSGCIHGRHRQGGSSAARFARHREKQIELFFTRACGHCREHIEPYIQKMDYIIYGGAWTTINAFKKQCSLLSRVTAPELAPLLDIGQPKQQVLEESVALLYSSRVFQWRYD